MLCCVRYLCVADEADHILTSVNMETPILTVSRCCVCRGWLLSHLSQLAEVLHGAIVSRLQVVIVDIVDFHQCWVGGQMGISAPGVGEGRPKNTLKTQMYDVKCASKRFSCV